MTDRAASGAPAITRVGERLPAGEPVPATGTWEVRDHAGCPGDGLLRALTRGEAAPSCPRCGQCVTWQLSHLSPTVAADHRGVGRLP